MKIQPKELANNPHHQEFLVIMRKWMGRLWSLVAYHSLNLYQLITRTTCIADRVLNKKDDLNQVNMPENKKSIGVVQEEIRKSNDISPGDSQEVLIESPIEKENTSYPTIIKSIFDLLYKHEVDMNNILFKGQIFDSENKSQSYDYLYHSDGYFVVEWNCQQSKLKYQGHFQDGKFDGQGCFLLENEKDKTTKVLLDGTFKQGNFIHGSAIFDECYVNGDFIQGSKKGSGIIYFLPDKRSNELFLYQGDFVDIQPHGEGKLFSLANKSMKLVRNGKFLNGKQIKGLFYDDNGNIFEGTFDPKKDTFKGKVNNFAQNTNYTGECQHNKFHGSGEYRSFQQNVRQIAEESETDDEEVRIRDVSEEITVKLEGKFRKGKLYNGEQIVKWNDDMYGITKFEKYKPTETNIYTSEYIYKGQFKFGTLCGSGSIYNADNEEIYRGQIQHGFPHGKGQIVENGQPKELGTFEYGVGLQQESNNLV